MAILMAKLTGNVLHKPHQRTAYNLWGPQNRCFVDPIFNERVREGNIPVKQQAALRSAVYKELFDELPEDKRRDWIKQAEEEHKIALKKAEDVWSAGPSAAPEDRQRYAPYYAHLNPFLSTVYNRVIESLPQFMQPILDLIADHTGWKILLITGGPEPADGGRLNIVRYVYSSFFFCT